MKKLYILCAAALGLAFTACDEVEDMTGLPQTNPQEAPFGTDAVAVTPGNSAVINLQALNASGEAVELAAATLTLRHTFCTNLANAGMNPKALQYIMGHSNITMTLNYYAHATFASARAEMERLIAA